MNLVERLINCDGLSESEKMIALFIIRNPKTAPSMSIRELASATFTSTSTVLRLCHKLGIDGFSDFKLKFSLAYRDYERKPDPIDVDLPFEDSDSEASIIEKIGKLTRDTITSCQLSLNPDSVKSAVEHILAAENVLAIGVSDSMIRVLDFQNKMLKINLYIQSTLLQPDQVFLCTHATEKDLALLVSYSGNTAEVINEARVLKKRSVPSIAITARKESPVAQLADTILLLPHDEDERVANYTLASQIAIEYALNVLFSCVYSRTFSQRYKHLLSSRKSYLHGWSTGDGRIPESVMEQ